MSTITLSRTAATSAPTTRLRLTTRGRRVLAGLASVPAVAALGIAFMLIAGYPLLADRITPFGYIALLAALGLLIWWIIRSSRRL